MSLQNWWKGVVTLSTFVWIAGCATEPPPAPSTTGQVQQAAPSAVGQVQQAVPPDSPFARVREGMGTAELKSILGEPTDSETSVTGKAFIPFYHGADRVVTRLYYKGLGQVYLSGEGVGLGGGGGRVIRMEYNPQESGFRK